MYKNFSFINPLFIWENKKINFFKNFKINKIEKIFKESGLEWKDKEKN